MANYSDGDEESGHCIRPKMWGIKSGAILFFLEAGINMHGYIQEQIQGARENQLL